MRSDFALQLINELLWNATLREQGGGKDKAEGVAAVSNSDTEYQTGRRVEQIVGTLGSVRRINVGVVVPRGVAAERLDRVRQIVAMAVGLDKDRGNGIAVYSLAAAPMLLGDAERSQLLENVKLWQDKSAPAQPQSARGRLQ